MATISEVKLWADVGYMEGDIEIPKIGASLPTPSFTFDGPFVPSKGRILSQIQIPENWYNLQDMSYIGVTLIINNGSMTPIYEYIYGWIDSVTMLSDNAESPMCEINWHVDYWRTYAKSMTFKQGLVKRAPSSSFPQTQAMTYWTVSDNAVVNFMSATTLHLTETIVMYWLLISYVDTSGSNVVNKFFATPLTGLLMDRYIAMSGSDPAMTISLEDFIFGTWDEKLGLDPAKIKGAWISPISPNSYTGTGTKTDPYSMTGWYGVKLDSGSFAAFYAFTANGLNPFGEYTASILNGAQTTDTAKYAITGFDGEIIQELPWGKYVSSLTYRIAASANSAYIQIRESGDSHAEGTCFTIPLPVVDTIENALSTYNYSGQRDYDITMKQLAVYQQLAGSTQSAIGGAIAGGASGAGVVGAAAGAGLGLSASLISAGMSQFVWNPLTQEAQDTLVSKQSDGLLMSGAAVIDIIYRGRCPRLIKMIADTPSITRRSSVLSRYGYAVNTAYESCQSLINSGGPLQISNLSIRGNAPAEAKQYVKALFERGVKLV